MFVTLWKEKKGKESAYPSLVELYDLLRANIRSVLETCLELIVGDRFSKYFHTVTRFNIWHSLTLIVGNDELKLVSIIVVAIVPWYVPVLHLRSQKRHTLNYERQQLFWLSKYGWSLTILFYKCKKCQQILFWLKNFFLSAEVEDVTTTIYTFANKFTLLSYFHGLSLTSMQ